jgi:hypothetical protein
MSYKTKQHIRDAVHLSQTLPWHFRRVPSVYLGYSHHPIVFNVHEQFSSQKGGLFHRVGGISDILFLKFGPVSGTE